ncbi:MAG: hypothetical protein A3G73_09465 [Rhodospirillales bacterium RIFCSPLOWO2_12_FULL_67_15]|nr:MAG: hypothetical protein A3G73_09465 [Rhodospirillales bacterium RIFCSPLOWO2_12_FULL_67_15]
MPLAHPRKSNARRKESRLNLRASAQQDALIRKAAASLGKNVTEFVLDSACANAEHVLADRRHFVLDEARWKAFLKALDRPAVERPRLKKLLTTPSVIERS